MAAPSGFNFGLVHGDKSSAGDAMYGFGLTAVEKLAQGMEVLSKNLGVHCDADIIHTPAFRRLFAEHHLGKVANDQCTSIVDAVRARKIVRLAVVQDCSFKEALKRALAEVTNDDDKSRCMVSIACVTKIADISAAFCGLTTTELLEEVIPRAQINSYIAHGDMLVALEQRIAEGIFPEWAMPPNVAWLNVKGFNAMFTEDKIKVILNIGRRLDKDSIKNAACTWTAKVPLTRASHIVLDGIHDRVRNVDFGSASFAAVAAEYETILSRAFAG